MKEKEVSFKTISDCAVSATKLFKTMENLPWEDVMKLYPCVDSINTAIDLFNKMSRSISQKYKLLAIARKDNLNPEGFNSIDELREGDREIDEMENRLVAINVDPISINSLKPLVLKGNDNKKDNSTIRFNIQDLSCLTKLGLIK